MTLESVILHGVRILVESLKTDELHQTKSILDERAEKELQELLVQMGSGAEYRAAADTESSSEDESETLTKVLSKWRSLSEDLQELEGESGTLVEELFCHVPAVLSKTPGAVKTSSASDPPAGAKGDSLQMKEKETEAESMTLESITLAKVKAEVGGLETKVLLEIRDALEKEAEVLAKEEKMEVKTTTEDVGVFEDTTEAERLTLESISEATDAIEAETSDILEAMFGFEQGPKQPPDTLLADHKLGQQDEEVGLEAERESAEQEGGVSEAMTLESVTWAEVKASLGTLENEFLSEAADYLETEAEILAGEKRMEVEGGGASEETTEALKVEFLSLSEALQVDALMEELLFSLPWAITGVTEDPIGQEVVRANTLDAMGATGSVDVDTATAVTDDLKEVLLGQEVEEEGAQTGALGNEDGEETHADPVQRLFLEKIREYDNMRRLNGGPLEAEPDYEKHLSEETAKLQRLYGGGDLSSFPEFTFTEPKLDQDSK
ncbi:uro-adherence factor A isoform X2 [Enoplosus armatus]|uniref:uro-adherence factor A isoform X2 n=1 Tax=Enoplosus armatus TaxID=215367 RepID=UPI003994FB5D